MAKTAEIVDVNTERTVDFNKKLDHLCELFKITGREALQKELARYGIRRILSSGWGGAAEEPKLRGSTRDRFAHYWYAEHRLPFIHDCYLMPFDEFKAYLERMNPPRPADPPKPTRTLATETLNRVRVFADTYQIIRPLTDRSNGYALEAYEIGATETGIQNFMYSQTTSPDRNFLYEGDGALGDRYYFALLTRYEDNNETKVAYRCIAFYMGKELPANLPCLSGLMLRGVRGDRTPTQVTAIPFIALRVPGHTSLKEPRFTELQPGVLRRLSPDGHILVGEIDDIGYGKLYNCCHSIFTRLRIKETNLLSESGVLHTVSARDLQLVREINLRVWRESVEDYLRSLPDPTGGANEEGPVSPS